ncbi:MAG: sterol desaturase family protein [Elusimicrobia bacterium]|nr:sterol desaturase family protein [Elusimicrobiota bacterium]
MIPRLLLSAAAACLYAEFVGYWLHVLLHSEKIPFLSRNHMIHHLVVYAPDKPQRPSRNYLDSTYGRASLLGIGLEWLLPVALILGATTAVLTRLGVGAPEQAVFAACALGWGALMFWYMHDAMHLQGFWMEGSLAWKRWFLDARRRHDVHHMDLSDAGRMNKNYGICFFGFDRLFGSFQDQHVRFNHPGHEAAKRRYAGVLAGVLPDGGR